MERIEILGTPSFEDGLNEALNALEDQGLGNSAFDPEVTIVIKTNGRRNFEGQKEVDVRVYLDAYNDEVANDILSTY